MDKSSPLPMNCTAIRKKLSAFKDGEVSAVWRTPIEVHLAACSDCRQFLVDLHRLWLALEDAPHHPPPDFSQEIMRKITEQSELKPLNRILALDLMFPAPATMVVMVVLGLCIGAWMGRTVIEERMVASPPGQVATLEGLDVFTPTPKGSLAQGYLVLVSNAAQVKQ